MEQVWDYLKKEGIFSLNIPKSYGGRKFSAIANSTIITRITTKSLSVAVTVMAPNSLGPGELLMHYGTHAQKDFWLPGLANGKEVLDTSLKWDKHYITLAPRATELGLAFKLYGPEKLLGDKEELDITCALIHTSHPDERVGDRHYPMGLAFLNGPTFGKDIFMPPDWIIGGPDYAGRGI